MRRPIIDLSECEQNIHYEFKNRDLLKKALTHCSYSCNRFESNERLEFLGDATLGLVISNFLYAQYPQMEEGELSQIKSVVVSRKNCCRVALQLGLDRFLLIGKGLNSIPNSLISNVVESIIGAIFLDGGYEAAKLFIENNFVTNIMELFPNSNVRKLNENELNDKEKTVDSFSRNYKAQLQTKVQREYAGTLIPIYLLLEEQGPPHRRFFKVAAQIDAQVFQPAWANNKKEAEQRAAENALRQLQGLAPTHSDLLDES